MTLFEQQANEFATRHIGPNEHFTRQMLRAIGVKSMDELIEKTVPASIRMPKTLNVPAALTENEYLKHIKEVSLKNKVYTNYIGLGLLFLSVTGFWLWYGPKVIRKAKQG